MNAWEPGTPIEANFYNHGGDPVVYAPTEEASSHGRTLVDLFSGCGGFSVGFAAAGFIPVLGIDLHEPSIDTFRANHPSGTAILGDIRSVDANNVISVLSGRPVDVVTAGVPCQGFSRTNRKRWDGDERNLLFLEFIRFIQALQPHAVVLENVSGIRSAANGSFVRSIAESIEASGYRVESKMLNAADFGVPQKRQRVFFVGLREDEGFVWPCPRYGTSETPYRSVLEAIGDLPVLAPGEQKDAYESAAQSDYQSLMRGECRMLTNHRAPNHPADVIRRIEQTAQGDPMYSKFKQRIRLHNDAPSPTQVCGGIRPQFQFGHPTQPRGLSIRERARIQSFPDDFVFSGGLTQGRVQTGNAVPPLLAQALAESIRDSLDGKVRNAKTSPVQMSLLRK